MVEHTMTYMAEEISQANQRILRLEAQRDDLLAALERALVQMCINIDDTEMAVIVAASAAIAKARHTEGA